MPVEMAAPPLRILVIKLGALGDMVLAFAPFAAIRAHHPRARITLLTTQPFLGLASASPWFDSVALDQRPRWWDLKGLGRLRRLLSGYDLVYDLQTSGRSSRYFTLAGRPRWSGIAAGCALPDADPGRNFLHTRERQAGQLARAGIDTVPDPDLSWLAKGGPSMPGPFALLVPGASPHRPAKRWPAVGFGVVARDLHRRGLIPVVVGGPDDKPLAAEILLHCPEAVDLTGRTSLLELGGLGARAAFAIGNDTGPMHLAAAMGCRSLVLFSRESNPSLTAPRGRTADQVEILRVPDLGALPTGPVLARVAAGLAAILAAPVAGRVAARTG